MVDIAKEERRKNHAFSPIRKFNYALGATILLISAAGFIGIALIATAPFDGPSRSNVGAGLLTGVVVGIALMGFESILDYRREMREREALKERQKGFQESCILGLSSLIIDSIEHLLLVFFTNVDARPDVKSQPPHWRSDSDRELVVRGLMWCAELPYQNPLWWREQEKLAACDAIFTVAIDIAQRSMIELSQDDVENFNAAIQKAVQRLAIAAERLSESGDPYRAHDIDKISDSLMSIPPRWIKENIIDLGDWGWGNLDNVITSGSPLEKILGIVSFSVDLVRADLDIQSMLGTSRVSEVPISGRRWGILTDKQSTNDFWNTRFADDSWLRRLLNDASNEVQQMFGIKPNNEGIVEPVIQ